MLPVEVRGLLTIHVISYWVQAAPGSFRQPRCSPQKADSSLRVMAAFPETGGVSLTFLKEDLDNAAQDPSLPNSRTGHEEKILTAFRGE